MLSQKQISQIKRYQHDKDIDFEKIKVENYDPISRPFFFMSLDEPVK